MNAFLEMIREAGDEQMSNCSSMRMLFCSSFSDFLFFKCNLYLRPYLYICRAQVCAEMIFAAVSPCQTPNNYAQQYHQNYNYQHQTQQVNAIEAFSVIDSHFSMRLSRLAGIRYRSFSIIQFIGL